MENFLAQEEDYKSEVLPDGYRKVAIEFSNDSTWYKILDKDDDFIHVSEFGKSGCEEDVLKDLELDIPSLVMRIKNDI